MTDVRGSDPEAAGVREAGAEGPSEMVGAGAGLGGADERVGGARFVTPEEGRELFDRQARRRMGISGDEFLHRYEGGEYDDVDCTDSGVMAMLMLLPFARAGRETSSEAPDAGHAAKWEKARRMTPEEAVEWQQEIRDEINAGHYVGWQRIMFLCDQVEYLADEVVQLLGTLDDLEDALARALEEA